MTTTARRTDPWRELTQVPTFRRGMAGVVALYAGLVLVWVFCVPLFGPADERAHVDYMLAVAHGNLPVAGQGFVASFPELGQVSYVQHVSNHPPLWYLIVGPWLRFTAWLGAPAFGLYAIRLFNALLTLVTILVVARIAAEATAKAREGVRIATVITASLLVAVNPALLAASGAIQNDALAVLLGALVVLVLARAARTGVTTRTVATLALLCTLGTLTRVTFITVVAVAVVATVALSLWPELRMRRPEPAAWRPALLRGFAIGAAVLAGAGWFLVLNLSRYGDLTGGSAVYQIEWVQERTLAPGAAHGPIVYPLHPYSWWMQFLQLAAPVPSISNGHWPYKVTTAALIAVLLWAAITLVRRRRAGWRLPFDRAGAATMLIWGGLFAASLAKLAAHVTNRGGANQRYLLDAIGLWAIGGAVLLLALGRLAPYAIGLVGSLGALAVVCYAGGITLRTDDVIGGSNLAALRTSLTESIVPGAGLVCVSVLILAVTGLWLAVSSVKEAVSP